MGSALPINSCGGAVLPTCRLVFFAPIVRNLQRVRAPVSTNQRCDFSACKFLGTRDFPLTTHPAFLSLFTRAAPRDGAQKCQLADPDSSAELTAQLSALGLRLHNTLGDGNCLFRALSDQLYGTESHHLKLRAEITAWMAKYAERYEGFVEDDRSFEDHLRCMREPGQFAFLVGLASYGMIRSPRRALCARIDRQPS